MKKALPGSIAHGTTSRDPEPEFIHSESNKTEEN